MSSPHHRPLFLSLEEFSTGYTRIALEKHTNWVVQICAVPTPLIIFETAGHRKSAEQQRKTTMRKSNTAQSNESIRDLLGDQSRFQESPATRLSLSEHPLIPPLLPSSLPANLRSTTTIRSAFSSSSTQQPPGRSTNVSRSKRQEFLMSVIDSVLDLVEMDDETDLFIDSSSSWVESKQLQSSARGEWEKQWGSCSSSSSVVFDFVLWSMLICCWIDGWEYNKYYHMLLEYTRTSFEDIESSPSFLLCWSRGVKGSG